MPIVIAGGQSVTDYDGLHLANLARCSFTFGVNDSGLMWPCDVIVALDYDWVRARQDVIRDKGLPVITRKWDCLKDMGLDLIEVPNDIPWRLSGMVACKIADSLASEGGRRSYVIGMDGTKGHYYNDDGDCSDKATNDDYGRLGLKSTTNLGVRSKINVWPKSSHLPAIKKVMVNKALRTMSLVWVRCNAAKVVI